MSNGIVGEEFEVIDPEDSGFRTSTDQPVSATNAAALQNSNQKSMRLNLMANNPTDQQTDYDEELLDEMNDLPDGGSSPELSDSGRPFGNSEISMQTTELAR